METGVIDLPTTIKNLPAPVRCYCNEGVIFEIYRAKDLLQEKWADPALEELSLIARKSYDRYGERPLLDKYDFKAAIYLVRAKYSLPEVTDLPIEEWLSVRMVPGDGSFFGVGEPEIFSYGDKPIDRWMCREMNSPNDRTFWEQVASSSRMCGIHPFSEQGQVPNLSKKHKYTSVCFAMIHAQFLIDYPFPLFPYRYITAIIRHDYLCKGLSIKKEKGGSMHPFFLPAEQFLGILPKSIHVDRKLYAYRFPSYWLHAEQMKTLVVVLVRAGIISRNYLENPFRILTDPPSLSMIRYEDLLKLVDDNVEDVPELKITPAWDWYHGISRVLRTAGVVMPEFLTVLKDVGRD